MILRWLSSRMVRYLGPGSLIWVIPANFNCVDSKSTSVACNCSSKSSIEEPFKAEVKSFLSVSWTFDS